MHKILILDDDAIIRMLYADELEEEGYEVIAGDDGSNLLELIGETGPDLVVMDIRLGRYNAFDSLQEVRNAYCDLPVVLCTAYPVSEFELKSVAAEHLVMKSMSLSDLKTKIKTALEGGDRLSSSATDVRDHEVKTGITEQMTWPWEGRWDHDVFQHPVNA